MMPWEEKKRERLVRRDGNISDARPERSVEELLHSCVIVIDKPKGPTSHQVADWAKKILGAKKAGQAGTLDPAVTGLLPIGVEKATKALSVLLSAGKEYVCSMHVHDDHPEEVIRSIMQEKFVGAIRQYPPVKSAIHRRWRTRHIYYIEILEVHGREVLFRVGCQAGTYIRKLCYDIGKELGSGAHMAQLIRTKSGGFSWSERVTLQDLADAMHWYREGDPSHLQAMLLPVEELARHLPRIWVADDVVQSLSRGVQTQGEMILAVESGIEPRHQVAAFAPDGRLVLIGHALLKSEEMVHSDETAVKTERVIIDQF